MQKVEHPFRYLISRVFVNFPSLFVFQHFYRNGYKLSFSQNSITANAYIYGDNYLQYDEIILTSLINEEEFFIDVGANIGHLSLAIVKNKKAIGIAIEANPKTFEVLKKNIELNKSETLITYLNYAVSDNDEEILLIQDSNSDDCNSVIQGNNMEDGDHIYKVKHKKTIPIKSIKLDTIANNYNITNKLRLLKIDVEGFELKVLIGSIKLLKITELIYFEYWEKLTRKYGYDKNELFAFLEKEGFCLYSTPVLNFKGMPEWGNIKPLIKLEKLTENVNLLAVNNKLNVKVPFKL